MPLKKLVLKPGVNRENTRYSNEGGWYESDKIRFRQGTPEKIGGWSRFSTYTFLGICRSLWNWITLSNLNLLGLGTNLKFYLENGGGYNDVTPIRSYATLSNPFVTVNTSTTVTVKHTSHGAITGDYVTFSNAATVGGLNLNGEYQLTYVDANSYTIISATAATSSVPGGGGGTTVQALYQINVGLEYEVPLSGWGAGGWGLGVWGYGSTSTSALRLWSQSNFGEDLVASYNGSQIYYWDAQYGVTPSTFTVTIASPAVVTSTVSLTNNSPVMLTNTGYPSALPTNLTPGVIYYVINSSGFTFNLALTAGGVAINTTGTQSGTHYILPNLIPISALYGASDTPTIQNFVYVSDVSRFVFAFGCNDYSSAIQDPMLIRWSDQESVTQWTPSATNQAGSVRLSHGSYIVTSIQTRQEIVVLSDSAVYSLQYVGLPAVWSTQLLGDNISIISQNAIAQASGIVFWMGIDKFYFYDGRVQTLKCDLLRYVYQDINLNQNQQCFASTNEGFNEVWFFYCSKYLDDGVTTNTAINRYVIYNYSEKNATGGIGVWYYGTLGRTAWLDSGLRNYPIAATYTKNLVNHEYGTDDDETGTPVGITSYVSSSEFDIDDGDKFGFIWRMLPDLTFSGSAASPTPQATFTFYPMQNSGSGTGTAVAGTVSELTGAQYTIAAGFTGQINTRVRGRQLILKVGSTNLGTTWQLGAPRIDIRPDGRR
jgi:hypothetical protein